MSVIRPLGKWSLAKYVLFALPVLFLVAFFFIPLIRILFLGFSGRTLVTAVVNPYFRDIIWFTFWQALLSTVLTLIIGLPAAFLFARYEFPGRSLIRALVTVPFVLPTVVVAAALSALLGPQGPVNQILMNLTGVDYAPLRLEQTITLILIAHIYYNVAVVIRLVGGYWASIDEKLVESARVLGASPLRSFFEVTLPLLKTPIASASSIIFLFCFTSFGVILILGGAYFSTIETEIFRQYVTFLNPGMAGALSLIQVFFTMVLMMLYANWQRRAILPVDFRPQRLSLKRPGNRRERLTLLALVSGLLVFMLSPLAALVFRSLVDREGNITLTFYQALNESRRGSITFIPPLVAIRNSLGYALLTMLLAGTLGLITSLMLTQQRRLRGLIEPLVMLPLGASAVTLGFGYVISYRGLRTSPVLVLLGHTLVAMPFVVRSLLPVLQGIRPNLREAAALLGASPIRVWREVDLPIIGRAMLVAAVFAFTISMGEFGATSFIVRPDSGFLTMPIAIQRFLGQPGSENIGQAMAMSSILMAVCTVGFLIIEKFRYGDIGEF